MFCAALVPGDIPRVGVQLLLGADSRDRAELPGSRKACRGHPCVSHRGKYGFRTTTEEEVFVSLATVSTGGAVN